MASALKLLSLVFVSTAWAKSVDQCPLIHMRQPEECFSLTSECWSPGEPDVDCPNNGICCFDGCINVCGFPAVPPPVPATETPCITEYVTQTEDVPEEVCTDVPGMETCTTVNTSKCEQECHWEDRPETVTESTSCCENIMKLKCENLTCDPDSGTNETITVVETVCKKREKVCYNVPEKVCQDEEVEKCRDVQSMKCQIIKKPREWPEASKHCETRYFEKCSVINREVCQDFYAPHYNPKLQFLVSKKLKKFLKYPNRYNAGCYTRPEKICRSEPVTDCNYVNATGFEEAEECQPITETICQIKVVPKCTYVDKERCNEAEDICETRESTRTLFVKADCDFVDQECQFVEHPECEEKFHQVEKLVPKKVCKNVCVPVVHNECERGEATQDCRNVFKTVSYKVPVLKC